MGPIHSLAWLRLASDITPEPSLELAPFLSLVDERGWGQKVNLRRLGSTERGEPGTGVWDGSWEAGAGTEKL